MGIIVPLILQVSDAVIYRANIAATRAADPPGAATSGFDDAFREPVAYDTTAGASIADRAVERVEFAPIRVPCQIEVANFNMLKESYQGDLQQGEFALVFAVADLQFLNYIDPSTNKPIFTVGDRVSAIEKHNLPGVLSVPLSGDGMYFREVFPASWGFNDTYNLWVGIITSRDKAFSHG
jgi:hypothetical protein